MRAVLFGNNIVKCHERLLGDVMLTACTSRGGFLFVESVLISPAMVAYLP